MVASYVCIYGRVCIHTRSASLLLPYRAHTLPSLSEALPVTLLVLPGWGPGTGRGTGEARARLSSRAWPSLAEAWPGDVARAEARARHGQGFRAKPGRAWPRPGRVLLHVTRVCVHMACVYMLVSICVQTTGQLAHRKRERLN